MTAQQVKLTVIYLVAYLALALTAFFLAGDGKVTASAASGQMTATSTMVTFGSSTVSGSVGAAF